jgi:hypothetical protein
MTWWPSAIAAVAKARPKPELTPVIRMFFGFVLVVIRDGPLAIRQAARGRLGDVM